MGYVLGRSFAWADNTAIGDAVALVGDGEHLHPTLGPALARWLLLRQRLDGEGFSVADVQRAQWWRRGVDTWQELVTAATGIGWPGSTAWRDLRLAHLSRAGWTPAEIGAFLRVPVSPVRRRLDALARDLSWTVVCPVALPEQPQQLGGNVSQPLHHGGLPPGLLKS